MAYFGLGELDFCPEEQILIQLILGANKPGLLCEDDAEVVVLIPLPENVDSVDVDLDAVPLHLEAAPEVVLIGCGLGNKVYGA